MESQNRKKALELGHTHQPFCSEDDEPKNEGRCSGKPKGQLISKRRHEK